MVFGANGGIGSALFHPLRADRNFKHVVGFSRTSVPAVDLLTEATLMESSAFSASQGEIRLVLDATRMLQKKAGGSSSLLIWPYRLR